MGLHETGWPRDDQIEIGAGEGAAVGPGGQQRVDSPDHGGIEGVVDRWRFPAVTAVAGHRVHALLIERPFEKDGFGPLDQPPQGLLETAGGEMGCPHHETCLAVLFHPPDRLERPFPPGEEVHGKHPGRAGKDQRPKKASRSECFFCGPYRRSQYS